MPDEVTKESILVDYIGYLKNEVAQRNVHIEQLQSQNTQLTNLLVGMAGPGQDSVLPDSGPVDEEYDAALLGGEPDLAGIIARHKEG